MKQSNNHTTMI